MIKHKLSEGTEGKLPEVVEKAWVNIYLKLCESSCAQISSPESQRGNKSRRIMVTQKLISLLTWQEEGEGEGKGDGRGKGGQKA